MTNYKKFKLNELGTMKNGANYPKGSYGKGIKIVNVKDLFHGRFVQENTLDELKENVLKDDSIYTVEDGDILFTRSSLVRSGAGMCAMINEPKQKILFCGFIIRFRIFEKKKVYPLYLLYLLRSPSYRALFTGNQQTCITNINQDSLGDIDVSIPIDEDGNIDFSKQVELVKNLDLIDQKIALNNKTNTELENMAKTIYDYWFTQFDFPDKNGHPYKTSGGQMVYNETLKREIPIGWDVGKVESFIAKSTKKLEIPTSDILQYGKYPVIDQSSDFIAGYTNDEDAIISLADGAIIFGDHTRVLKYINFPFARGGDGTQLIISSSNRIPTILFYHILSTFDLSNNGYARHYKFLKDKSIIVPDIKISQKFESIVTKLYSQIRENIQESVQLTRLRDYLLPLLMNGQIKVK